MELAPVALDSRTRDFYVRTLAVLNEAGVPYLVAGAYALTDHAGIERHTKDLDIMVRRSDRDSILRTLRSAGYRTEVSFPHWLAKAYGEGGFVDVIYSSGNGVVEVDEEWFSHASAGEILGVPVKLCPAEEMIWSKAYVQERERFDGADIAHLIRSRGEAMDWGRLLGRFGEHWRILFGHLITFGFSYPAERGKVPNWVLEELSGRLTKEMEGPTPEGKACFGTLLSREQYLTDIGKWGYRDARVKPLGPMTPEEVAHWTAAIAAKGE
jgi:Aminoglycoside-2''-adenylyltransferase